MMHHLETLVENVNPETILVLNRKYTENVNIIIRGDFQSLVLLITHPQHGVALCRIISDHWIWSCTHSLHYLP